ncbi:MAG: hypothetical protein JW857_11350 [Bacteroidales bacterium]|nr:hypothetical protein [Bacteroidales bacterium]
MNKEHTRLMLAKLENRLNEKDLADFNQLMAENEDFRKEFEILTDMIDTLKDQKAMDLRNKLDKIYFELYGIKKKKNMSQIVKRNWYSVAAAAAIIIMVGAFWFNHLNQKKWNEQLYETYYQEDEVFVNTRSKANFNVDVLHHGMELLEQKDFDGALVEFNKLPNSLTANYYAGVANMELNNHEIAVFKFDYVIDDYLNLFYDQAQWYKGLCLVKLERKNEAIQLFDQISQTESYFKDKAKQIVSDLKEK